MTALQVLVCEDSRVYAAALRRMLEYDGDIAVRAVCTTAEEAITALTRIEPDLVTMDLELPGMDGLEAVGEIMGARPLPILVLSAYVGPRSDKAAAALAAGALDALAKDDLDLRDPAGAGGAAFRHRIKALSRAHVIRHPRARLSPRLSGPSVRGAPGAPGPRGAHGAPGARGAPGSAPGLPHRASVVGMCASVGGPQLLAYLLGALPADYAIPILVVQHMAAGFTEGLIRWLDQSAEIAVRVAAAGVQAGPGAWFAPDGAHLRLAATGRLELDRHTVAGRYRPSGDVLLRSIASATGQSGVAVVLSGMGSDGAAGAAAVRRGGGLALAQDEQSSAVFGMPRAAIDLGVDVVLSPGEIAACLLALRPEALASDRR